MRNSGSVVLMEKLFDVGVNGKILRSWYDGGSCCVKVDGRLSEMHPVERGVKQGSVLSPALFLLVLDPRVAEVGARALHQQLLCWGLSTRE